MLVRILIASMVLWASPLTAQPRIVNGELRAATIAGPLTRDALIASAAGSEATWIGYAVSPADGERQICCWNGADALCCQLCGLEPGARRDSKPTAPPPAVVRLEGDRRLHVLYRVEGGQVDRIRIFGADCPLDAGGRIVHWLSHVAPGDSVATLAGFLAGQSSRRLVDDALSALAMHADAAALRVLLTTARDGTTSHHRSQSLFWLAQRAGAAAASAITEAVERDPDTAVKRQAVFALSQLPRDEGVPLLIEVARTNRNPVVRRQAIFWLGQSKDPRALRFFEEILFP